MSTENKQTSLAGKGLAGVTVLESEAVGVADVVSAASLLVSKPALGTLTARAAAPGSA